MAREDHAPVNVAVIGAGNWGKNIVRTLHGMGALAAVAEPFPALRANVERDFPGVPCHPDHRAILADQSIRAVAIATRVPTHAAIARECLLAGKDVFVEKPLTLSTDDAEELVALASKTDRVLMVGHLLLYQPAIQFIANALREGLIGRVHALHQERLNHGKARGVENALWSLGVHDVAVLLHLAGSSPTRIVATGQSILGSGVEDDVHLHLDFANGARAHVHNSWLWPEKRRRLTIIGDAGMLVYDEADQTVSLHRKTIDAALENRNQGTEIVFRGEGEPLRLELEHFVARVRDRSRPLSDGASGVEVVRVLEKASRMLQEEGYR